MKISENLMRAESSFLWFKKKKPQGTYTSRFICNCRNFVTPPSRHWNTSVKALRMCWHPIKSNESIFNKITLKYVLAFQVVTMWYYLSNMSVAPAWGRTQNPFTGHRRKSVPVIYFCFLQRVFVVLPLCFEWLWAIFKIANHSSRFKEIQRTCSRLRKSLPPSLTHPPIHNFLWATQPHHTTPSVTNCWVIDNIGFGARGSFQVRVLTLSLCFSWR